MKREEITTTKIRLTLSADDVHELLPDEEFRYDMYYDYRDELSEKTFVECMPEEHYYKDEEWNINYKQFAHEWKLAIEDQVRDWNIDDITDEINKDLTDRVSKALAEKWIEYDVFEFDFYPDEIYSINLDIDYLLSRSKVYWNVIWFNNFDWFTEWETFEDDLAIKQFIALFPELATQQQLENACNDWMYTGSDLKVNYKSSMLDFLNILETGKMDISWASAVLHLYVNWSWSPEFTLWTWEVEFGKKYWSEFNRRDWWLDRWSYSVRETYWWAINVL